MKNLEDKNIKKHGDEGPFLVCAATSLIKKKNKDGFVSACFKCRTPVYIPEKEMVKWRNTGSIVVCPLCSGGKIGQILETF